MVRLPALTHLQFLILNLIAGGRHALEIRAELTKFWEQMGSPTFCQLMRRLEEIGLVFGLDGADRQREYRLTPEGRRLHDEAVEFYQGRMKCSQG